MVWSEFYDFQVIDLTSVSPELAYLASDADLVILEGMVYYVVEYLDWGEI